MEKERNWRKWNGHHVVIDSDYTIFKRKHMNIGNVARKRNKFHWNRLLVTVRFVDWTDWKSKIRMNEKRNGYKLYAKYVEAYVEWSKKELKNEFKKKLHFNSNTRLFPVDIRYSIQFPLMFEALNHCPCLVTNHYYSKASHRSPLVETKFIETQSGRRRVHNMNTMFNAVIQLNNRYFNKFPESQFFVSLFFVLDTSALIFFLPWNGWLSKRNISVCFVHAVYDDFIQQEKWNARLIWTDAGVLLIRNNGIFIESF